MSKVKNRSIENFLKPVTRKNGFRTKDLEKGEIILAKAIDPCCTEVTFVFDTATTPASHQFFVKNAAGNTVFVSDLAGGNIQTATFGAGNFTVCIKVITTEGLFLQVNDANDGTIIFADDLPGEYCAANAAPLLATYTASTLGS